MAVSRTYYLDLASFYCWVRKVFDKDAQNCSWDLFYPAEEEWVRWRGLDQAVGYLLDFSTQWKVHSGPMWMEHGVPFHYTWHEGLSTNEHFHSWDPVTLEAYNKSTEDTYKAGAMSRVNPLHSGSYVYDRWLQRIWPVSENTSEAGFDRGMEYYSPQIRFFIEDFEGWHKRPMTSMTSGEISFFTTLYYYEDVKNDGSPYRKFFRWRPRTNDPYA